MIKSGNFQPLISLQLVDLRVLIRRMLKEKSTSLLNVQTSNVVRNTDIKLFLI